MKTVEPFDLLIRHGDVALPEGLAQVDVGVRGGRVAAIAPALDAPAERTIDAAGGLVFPGFIDPHTHMGIPIKETTSADDFASGSVAAAFGGITTILDFTVQAPGQTLREAVDERLEKARGHSHVDFGIHVNITDRPLDHLHEIPRLIADGFTSFKLFSTYREAGMMIGWPEFRRVMREVGRHGGLVMLHAEDNEIVEAMTEQYLAEARSDAICHARSRPAEAEAKAVRDAAAIAGEEGAPLYIVHLSSRAGLEAGLAARARGVQIYLETCPQYLLLTEDKYREEKGHYYITTPALRTEADARALWQALAEGAIDTAGTDHCPFTAEQKEHHGGAFHLTPNGMPGVETLFPLLYTYGVAEGRISLKQMLDVLAENPARIFGIDHRKGSIRPGADADFVIWNPEAETVVTAPNLHGRADWSPFEGMRIAGRLEYTILRGEVLVEGDRFVGENVQGRLLRARPLSERQPERST
ncbi:MAG: dihydropyrimidinase [Candidatus Promineifilaceae bacterium]|nr:dihydropyrimidinase [Candidatus Promineifilaceae bacterium]